MSSETFRTLFASVRSSAFRLETLQHYTIQSEAEALRGFLDGQPGWQHPVHQSPWLGRLREMTAQGKRWQRVHIVSHPLSDYLRFEIAGYQAGVDAGEDIRLANREAHPELSSLTEDFWLFDARTEHAVGVIMSYDDHGRLIGRERADSPDELDKLCRQRDLAIACSMPLRAYLAQAAEEHSSERR